MAFVAVDEDKEETIFNIKPRRYKRRWTCPLEDEKYVVIPKGIIEKLIGKKLTWEDEPVELKEQIEGFSRGGYIETNKVKAGVVHN